MPPADEPNSNPAPAGEELPGGLPANDPNGESTTPEEVASVLKSSGMKLPEGNVDDEEGDDPDKPAAGDEDEPAGDEPTGDEGDEDEPTGDNEDPAAADEPEDKPPARTTPDDFATDDDKYAFEIEDANGVTFKVMPGAKMEDILKEFEPKNNGQIIDILNQLQKAEAQKASDEAKAAEDQATQDRQARADELLKSWSEEATALQASGRIPDGEDGTTRINDVYKFMADENEARMKAGKPTLNSFEDALDKLEAKEARDKAAADAKAEKEEARKKGALVGGSSAAASKAEPVYKAGSAKNANQALRSMGLLS